MTPQEQVVPNTWLRPSLTKPNDENPTGRSTGFHAVALVQTSR